MNRSQLYKRIFLLALLSLFVIVISYPRFNRQDIFGLNKITRGCGIEFVSDKGFKYSNLSSDAEQYLLLVKYWREISISNRTVLTIPYLYRPFAPFIASFLPFDEMTSLNILNLISLLISLVFLEIIITKIGVKTKPKFCALMLFTVSFPTFYYTTIAHIDPVFILFLTLGLWSIITNKWFLFPIIIFCGTLTKEGMLILLPIPFVVALFNEMSVKKTILLSGLVGFFFFIISTVITRIYLPTNGQFLWIPSIHQTILNLMRFRTIFGIGVTFLLPGLFSLLMLHKNLKMRTYVQNPTFSILFSGLLVSIAFCIFGVITVPADGRYIWPAYVFCVPLTALWFNESMYSLQFKNRLRSGPLLSLTSSIQAGGIRMHVS